MPQQVGQKPNVVLNKGLITEASELNFPQGASVDELNCDLLREGSRRRRLGYEYETGYETDASATLADGSTTSIGLWKNAGSNVGTNFVVVQLGGTLHFYVESTDAVSANKKSFTQALSTFQSPTGSASTEEVQLTSVQGYLVVSSSEINTFYIDYDLSGDSISSTEIAFRIRDFEWQGDTSGYSEEIASGSVTEARKYDTYNAGWKADGAVAGAAALTTYIADQTAYPALNLPWFSNKTSAGAFDTSDFLEIGAGTSLIANGSYIFDLYTMDRETAGSLSTSALNYTETTRFKTSVAFSERVFYGGVTSKKWGSTVFFTRVIQQKEDFGELLQRNDPTAEEFSDLLPDDGGYISIPEAFNIKKLHVLGTQVLVFAENGVWSIRGVDNSFDATAYSVSKLSSDGLAYTGSFIAAEGNRPYWWSTSGIHTLIASAEQQTLQEENISLPTIQTFFDNIDAAKKGQVSAAYDAFNRRLAWVYPDDDETVDGKMSKILWFDEGIGAFFPWTVSEDTTSKYIIKPFFSDGLSTSDIDFTVIDSSSDTVIDSSGDTVIVTRPASSFSSTSLIFLTRTDISDRITFGKFTGTDFLDWDAADYSSYLETEYEYSGDMTNRKTAWYLHTYCKVTETAIVGNDTDGYEYDRPSSLKVSPYWDFKITASQTAAEAYRLKGLPVPSAAGPVNYPKTVTVSRLRLRGRGRSLRLRWESTQGSDFYLLGYDMIIGRNQRP
jgi:hypothetical protein